MKDARPAGLLLAGQAAECRDPLDSHHHVVREDAQEIMCVSFQMPTVGLQALNNESVVDMTERLDFHADNSGSFP